MNWKTIITCLALLGQALATSMASAACFDPKTFISGYQMPLAEEIRTAHAIVIGRILSEKGLREDPEDPDGYTAFDVTVKITTRLKGRVPNVVVIRNENTSASYPMSVGEEHVLFISRIGRELWVNTCGNSTVMPAGRQVVGQIQARMRGHER